MEQEYLQVGDLEVGYLLVCVSDDLEVLERLVDLLAVLHHEVDGVEDGDRCHLECIALSHLCVIVKLCQVFVQLLVFRIFLKKPVAVFWMFNLML